MSAPDWRALLVYGVGLGSTTIVGLYALGRTGLVPVPAGTLFLVTSFVTGPLALLTDQIRYGGGLGRVQESQHEAAELRGETEEAPEPDDTEDPPVTYRGPLVDHAFYYAATTFALSVGGMALLYVR